MNFVSIGITIEIQLVVIINNNEAYAEFWGFGINGSLGITRGFWPGEFDWILGLFKGVFNDVFIELLSVVFIIFLMFNLGFVRDISLIIDEVFKVSLSILVVLLKSLDRRLLMNLLTSN